MYIYIFLFFIRTEDTYTSIEYWLRGLNIESLWVISDSSGETENFYENGKIEKKKKWYDFKKIWWNDTI